MVRSIWFSVEAKSAAKVGSFRRAVQTRVFGSKVPALKWNTDATENTG
jgi:hypothetical protein